MQSRRDRTTLISTAAILGAGVLLLTSCGGSSSVSPPAISLVQQFSDAEVTGTPAEAPEFPRLEWRFDGESTIAQADEPGPYAGWTPLNDIEQVRLEDGHLFGQVTGKHPILAIEIPEASLPKDLLAAIEVQIRTSAGSEFGIVQVGDDELDLEKLLEELEDGGRADFQIEIEPSDDIQTLKLTEKHMRFTGTTPLRGLHYLGVMLFEAEGAEFEIESVRLVTRNEELAGVPSGVGWQGMSDIYRETIVSRAPEKITFNVSLGERPWLDLAIGTPNPHPVTFDIRVESGGSGPLSVRRTLTTADKWLDIAMPLDEMARQSAQITLTLESDEEGQVGFWGAPTIRHRGALPEVSEPTRARAALGNPGPPKGVILIVADTLRSDHLDAWGYERSTSPFLSSLATQGTRFADNISQGPWTKVAVCSILTSLYRSTHGIVDIPDRIPASVTTMAESFRNAGYATFHASSVTFSGRNSNLQQGVEVLHEKASVTGLDGYGSKTARTYVDRLLPWLETHSEQPFFVFLHVFDPHSPFRPFDPYDRLWLKDEALVVHEENLRQVDEVVDVFHNLPSAEDLEKLGTVDPDVFMTATKAWYDASIKAMDVEIARLYERLAELNLADDTLVAFLADHGEEFLEHGESWHGHSIYGDMINVPMLVRWPGVVPADLVIEETTQSIDLMPTLLDLAQVPIPELAQGRSLVPLMAATESPGEYGWRGGPVFSEVKVLPEEGDDFTPDAYTVIYEGWKLIWNTEIRDERPELQLYDHKQDPLNLDNIAKANPEKVAELKRLLEGWRDVAEAARVTDEGLEESLSPEEVDELRALGYLN